MSLDPHTILLVEDSDDDAELTTMAFRKASVVNEVVRARNGLEALEILAGDLPALVLLDLKLPGLSGIEVLTAIRAQERTRHLPVVILTSSTEQQDRKDAYSQFANSYVQKPIDFGEFVEAAAQLGRYWTGLNQPPPR